MQEILFEGEGGPRTGGRQAAPAARPGRFRRAVAAVRARLGGRGGFRRG
jgi:hypothetical protein